MVVEFLYCCLKIGGSLILDKSAFVRTEVLHMSHHLPSAVALATDFGVDDVQSRLTGEVFEIL